MVQFRERRDAGLRARLSPIEGAVDAVASIQAQHAGRIGCASGADRAKVVLQLTMWGTLPHCDGRIFSGYEQPR